VEEEELEQQPSEPVEEEQEQQPSEPVEEEEQEQQPSEPDDWPWHIEKLSRRMAGILRYGDRGSAIKPCSAIMPWRLARLCRAPEEDIMYVVENSYNRGHPRFRLERGKIVACPRL
jgi:hypothetical protein